MVGLHRLEDYESVGDGAALTITADGTPLWRYGSWQRGYWIEPRIVGNFEWGIPLTAHRPAGTLRIDGCHCTSLKRIALFGYRVVLCGAGNVQPVSSLNMPWLQP